VIDSLDCCLDGWWRGFGVICRRWPRPQPIASILRRLGVTGRLV